MEYLVIIGKTDTGYSAYAPDLPGCVATGPTIEEVRQLMKDGIEFHIEGLERDNEPVPQPITLGEYIAA